MLNPKTLDKDNHPQAVRDSLKLHRIERSISSICIEDRKFDLGWYRFCLLNGCNALQLQLSVRSSFAIHKISFTKRVPKVDTLPLVDCARVSSWHLENVSMSVLTSVASRPVLTCISGILPADHRVSVI